MDIARLVETARGGSVRVVIVAERLVLHALSVTNKLGTVILSQGVQQDLKGSHAGSMATSGYVFSFPPWSLLLYALN